MGTTADPHAEPAPAGGPAHRNLPVAGEPASGTGRADRARRAIVVSLSLAAAALYALAFTRPFWHFVLYAPQYPKGLDLVISLTGLGGDVREIDMLNHYIGMGHLEDAAQLERHFAVYGIAGLAVVVVALTLFAGRRLSALVAVPGVLLPMGFLADSFYWLYAFGHHLNPHAPLRIRPFTPQLFGQGVIGQFRTYASPADGFWIALGALGLLVVAAILRDRVCRGCPDAGRCGSACPRAFLSARRDRGSS